MNVTKFRQNFHLKLKPKNNVGLNYYRKLTEKFKYVTATEAEQRVIRTMKGAIKRILTAFNSDAYTSVKTDNC